MKYKPDQRVKILQIEIALPDPAHDCLDGELEDEITALLTESGVFNTNSNILDWRYLNYGKERHAVAQPDTEENEIFLGKPDTAIEEIIARLIARRYKGLDDPVHSLTYRDVAQAIAAQLDHLPEAVALSQDWPKLLQEAIEATRLVSAFQVVEDEIEKLIDEEEDRPEVRLREVWLSDGVPISRQQELLDNLEKMSSPEVLENLFPAPPECCVCKKAILPAHGEPHWVHEEDCPRYPGGCDCDLYAHEHCCPCTTPEQSEDGWLDTAFEDRISGMEM